ncbi:hypothetical protein SPSIL_017700 [Sporomusa silvacetica DSM 10669]|uniref:Uncharacterized protein n=1 Tax=Sporomusa silvacetica DSM 10669 TaxID=1123289 RepID=A0ABZ3IIY6_9FIRM|nr:hypothetical protein SPSIL_26230 [Sporomusa silvacetica DSM 10669]
MYSEYILLKSSRVTIARSVMVNVGARRNLSKSEMRKLNSCFRFIIIPPGGNKHTVR